MDAEILRCAQDDSQDSSQIRSREVLSPNVCDCSRCDKINQQPILIFRHLEIRLVILSAAKDDKSSLQMSATARVEYHTHL